jgi:pyruvate carboxylase
MSLEVIRIETVICAKRDGAIHRIQIKPIAALSANDLLKGFAN